ncbi:MAG: hypothetical protein J6I84_05010 [Bacilli bacterium]|nr:hypothetical protein [Bacilli bacterium]
MAAKLYKLRKSGQTIFPVTVTDAVVDPESLETLTTILKSVRERLTNLEEQPGILWG